MEPSPSSRMEFLDVSFHLKKEIEQERKESKVAREIF